MNNEINIFEVYEFLPGLNCKSCGENTCMAFAEKLIKGQKTIAACAPLRDNIYKERKEELLELLRSANEAKLNC
ncbi:(Fe-S)-binding protein [Eubacteriaceae bacterium ES3]|nr:(Fe-S)-binding protein [Eubacteriaceae bacterium ES3]